MYFESDYGCYSIPNQLRKRVLVLALAPSLFSTVYTLIEYITTTTEAKRARDDALFEGRLGLILLTLGNGAHLPPTATGRRGRG